MPITCQWLLEKRVLLTIYSGDLTVDDFAHLTEEVRAHLDLAEEGLIHCLCDVGQVKKLPLSLQVLADTSRGALSHPQFGWMIAYDMPNPIFKFFGDMVTRLFRMRYHVAGTQEEALDFLNSVDATLPPLRMLARD